MKTVFVNCENARVGHAKSILDNAGILCFVRNDLSHNYGGGSLLGPLPTFDPELVVVTDTDYEPAMELLSAWTHPVAGTADWRCSACGETVPGTMGECWKCQTERPG